jgi:ribose transport system permease protein
MSKTNESLLSRINVFNKNSITPSLIAVYGLMILVFSLINAQFFTIGNFRGILATLSILGIIAVGLTTVVLSGNFDLSIGSTFGLTAVLVAKIFNLENFSVSIPLIILISLAIGLGIGAINGFFVTVLGINSIITTLATLAVFRGLAFYYSLQNISIRRNSFLLIGRYFIGGVIPLPFVYFLVVIILMYLFLRYTRFGRKIYLVGASDSAARLTGISIAKTQFIPFMISGAFASLAGMINVAQIGFANATFGNGYEFRILTICVLGGISLAGGRGTLVGVFIASLIMGSISNGLALIDVPINLRTAFTGIILIGAILIDSIRVMRKERLRL